MHEGAEKQKRQTRHWPRKVAVHIADISDPVKSDQGKNELGPPAAFETLPEAFGVLHDGNPKWDIAKQQSPRGQWNKSCSNQKTTENPS